jgi:hypothetical protein
MAKKKKQNDRTKKVGLNNMSRADRAAKEKAINLAKEKAFHKALLKEVKVQPTPKVESRPMGVPKGYQDVVMSRRFRWTLGSQNLREHFNKTLIIDYVNKVLHIQAYDVVTPPSDMSALVWGEHLRRKDLPAEELVFENYDGCGNSLSKTYFTGLSLQAMTTAYDYADSEPVVIAMSVKYEDCIMASPHSPYPITRWSMKVGTGKEQTDSIPVQFRTRPTLTIEKTEVNFLNGNIGIPGKGKWDEFELLVILEDHQDRNWLNLVAEQKLFDLEIQSHSLTTPTERWTIKNAWARQAEFGERDIRLTLRLGSVLYHADQLPPPSGGLFEKA